jgi:hypothetical protein
MFHSDKTGEINRKHGNPLVGTLRQRAGSYDPWEKEA